MELRFHKSLSKIPKKQKTDADQASALFAAKRIRLNHFC